MKSIRTVVALVLALLTAGVSGASAQSGWNGSLNWRAGKSSLDSGPRNAAVLSSLSSSVADSGQQAGRIRIATYSSPEGSLSWNTKLTERRTASLVDWIKENIPGIGEDRIDIVNVPEDWGSVRKYVRYLGSDVQWKAEALELLSSGKPDLETRLQDLWGGVAWDDLLWNCFTRIRRTEISVLPAEDTQVSPASAPEAGKRVLPLIKFAVGSTELSEYVLDNAFQLKDLSELAAGLSPDDRIVLDAYSSPEGKPSWNRVLARRRAGAVADKLVSLGISADRISVRCCEENWEGLRVAASELFSGEDLQQILSVIDDKGIDDSVRESRLAELSGGRIWGRFLAHGMSGLRFVKVSVNE